jgi:hypothetical protein
VVVGDGGGNKLNGITGLCLLTLRCVKPICKSTHIGTDYSTSKRPSEVTELPVKNINFGKHP